MTVAAILSAVACFAGTQGSTQLVTVDAARGSTYATVSLWARRDACWPRVAGPWPARVGSGGISTTKREGDGATPAGTYRLGTTMYGIAPDPGVVGFGYRRLRCGDWWVSDAGSPAYNRFRHVACGRKVARSEALWKIAPQYRYFVVVDYNTRPVVAGRGSAIFLHVSGRGATAGCVSLPEPRLVRLMRWLRPAATPLVRLGIS